MLLCLFIYQAANKIIYTIFMLFYFSLNLLPNSKNECNNKIRIMAMEATILVTTVTRRDQGPIGPRNALTHLILVAIVLAHRPLILLGITTVFILTKITKIK